MQLLSISPFRWLPTLFVATLIFSLPSRGECVREKFFTLLQTLSGKSPQEEVFKKYYADEDPLGWKKVVSEIIQASGAQASLGGNEGNTFSVSLPDGSSVVTKELRDYPLPELEKILKQLEDWKKRGIGPEILGVSLAPGSKRSERNLFLVMEDLLSKKNPYGTTLIGGNGTSVRLLKNQSPEARAWLLERMLSVLSSHSDPHPKNLVFRVTQLRHGSPLPPEGSYYRGGDKIYQVFLVDPSGIDGSPDHPLFNTEINQTAQPLLQYNHKWKRQFFQKELGL